MTDPNIRTELDRDGILLATIDMPGRTMNVFSAAMMDSLEALLLRVEQDAEIKGVVLTSGKSAFIAGADLDMIRMFTERARSGSTTELHALFGHLGRLFRRLELSAKPYVAAINGLALGGGLELALACHARVAADSRSVQLGLPEIKLGLLPGAGGTQRLPRLIGAAEGLKMLLTGEPVAPLAALALGLVDEVVATDQLIVAAQRRVRSLTAPRARWDQPGFSASASPFDFTDPAIAFGAIAAAIGISDEQLRHYPAYTAIIDCVVGGWQLPMTAASEREMDIFVELMRDPVAGNMVRALFLNRQRAHKLGLLGADSVLARGNDALLPRLRASASQARETGCSGEEQLLAVSLAAIGAWRTDSSASAELADAAIVAEGLHPAYTGGPYNYAVQHGAQALRERAAAASARNAVLFALPASFTDFFAASHHTSQHTSQPVTRTATA